MPEVNFYLKAPSIYTCVKHPEEIKWTSKAPCSICGKSLILRKGGRTGPDGKEIKPAGKMAACQIFLQVRYRGNTLIYYFGQKITPDKWDYSKQRIKSNNATTLNGQSLLNDLLAKLKAALIKGYNLEIAKGGVPSVERLKYYLNEVTGQATGGNQKDTFFSLFDRFINGEIKRKGKSKSKNTLQNYSTVKGHLLSFIKAKKYTLTFESINRDFFNKYTSYLENDLKLNQNTRAKDITIIKTVMTEAVELEYTTNMQFKHRDFSISEVETDSVYLTESEIIDLYKFDLSAKPKLEHVRDLFIVGCFTGLRYSDYSNIKPENIINDEKEYYIKMVTQKTKELVIIPCNPIVLEIFNKYEHNPNKLPNAISAQKFNEYIKDACKEAGMTTKGRLLSDPKKELYQCITSHTARRSFATNFYLQDFPVKDLKKITGHKTDQAFEKYIKVSQLQSAKRLGEHIKKNWSSKLLRVAG